MEGIKWGKEAVNIMKQCTIRVLRYHGDEMGYVFVDNKCVFSGNFWDFHDGCHGTKIGGYELDGLWTSGIFELAGVLQLLKEKDGFKVRRINKEYKRDSPDDIYERTFES